MNERLCKDCKFYKNKWYYSEAQCVNPKVLLLDSDPVHGPASSANCRYQRRICYNGKCLGGKYFEAKVNE